MKTETIYVKDIFKNYGIIHVPYYQRDYVWGKKNDGRNLYKFMDDIFTQCSKDSGTDYFIGTLAFCSAEVNDVIDGQQRLTSLVLILSVLADLKCSEEIKAKNKAIVLPNGQFVIQEDEYLTEELKFALGLENKFNTQGYKVNISDTVDKIKRWIDLDWAGKTINWYDGLYNYILTKVKLISIEYGSIAESVKYFLNINSLSIQLTQSDIFFSILSQSIRISQSGQSIFSIKRKIAELANFRGISNKIDAYKAYDSKDNGIDNIIYIFLNAYYQKDRNIGYLNEAGIGKWVSFYKNEVFNDAIKAREFTDKFTAFLKDFEFICKHLANMDVGIKKDSPLYLSWVLLQYEGYADILEVLLDLFEKRHNYITDNLNLYKPQTYDVCLDKLNEVAKRLNLTLIWNYVRSSHNRLDGFITNIGVDEQGVYTKSIEDIVGDMDMVFMFNLNYNDKKGVSKVKVKDESRIIKAIMGVQEAYLNFVANPSKSLSEYLESILAVGAFSVEHLYSVKEYTDKDRLNNWITKKSKFNVDSDFDVERFRFENLSLLNFSTNASANDDEIYDKLAKYKQARKVCNNEWEYLVQSLVEDSEYYRNEKLQALGLPKRTIINIDQNTWEISPNNREFNTKLLKMAIKQIAEG